MGVKIDADELLKFLDSQIRAAEMLEKMDYAQALRDLKKYIEQKTKLGV